MIEGQLPQFPNFRSSNCFYFQMFPYSNSPSIQVPFDILTFCNSDNLIFHWKTVLRKWVSSSSSCIYLTTNRFALEPLNAVFCEELFGVTIIWPFKSFMRPRSMGSWGHLSYLSQKLISNYCLNFIWIFIEGRMGFLPSLYMLQLYLFLPMINLVYLHN